MACRNERKLLRARHAYIKQATFIFSAAVISREIEFGGVKEARFGLARFSINTVGHEYNREAQTFGGVQSHYLDGVYNAGGVFSSASVVRAFCVMPYKPAETLDVFVGAIGSGAFVVGDGLA